MDILELVHKYLDGYIKKEYATDTCKPVYVVSRDIRDKTLVLTVTHMESSYSCALNNTTNLSDLFDNLYNHTM